MYCSLRFYIDETPDLTKAQNILGIFELFENVFGISYDYVLYTLFDPDKDSIFVDEKYIYNTLGKTEFLNANILPLLVGKNGDYSAPFITASCNGKSTKIYSGICVQTQFPAYTKPFIIKVDYKQKDAEKLTLQKYVFFVHALTAMGFRVNNCFYHVYSKKNEATTLDGGQVGSSIHYYGRQNLKKYLLHSREGCLNRFMDIYCFNSIRLDSIKNGMQEAIWDVVGNSNTMIVDGILSFALGDSNDLTPSYRIKYRFLLKKLRKLLL